ncbi:MAG TPA: hypothetical protein VHR86_07840 [Armatimonadota bacterium]|nr:hypothetical protein [Armatimonadota bacterium]
MKQQRRIRLGAGAKLVLVIGELLLFLLLAQSVLLYIQTDRAYVSVTHNLSASVTAGQEGSIIQGGNADVAQTEAQAVLVGQERLAGIFRIAGVVVLIILSQLFLSKIMRGIPPTRIPYL